MRHFKLRETVDAATKKRWPLSQAFILYRLPSLGLFVAPTEMLKWGLHAAYLTHSGLLEKQKMSEPKGGLSGLSVITLQIE